MTTMSDQTHAAPDGSADDTVLDRVSGSQAQPHVTQNTADEAPTGHDWARYGLVALLVGTAVLYLWGLSGWANSFYSAAAQAGAQNWEAFFFGSSDAANSITVDKPPASIWVMALSVRMFGLNSWSILVPQALMGMAAVYRLFTKQGVVGV